LKKFCAHPIFILEDKVILLLGSALMRWVGVEFISYLALLYGGACGSSGSVLPINSPY
jgi:hypothetical protein